MGGSPHKRGEKAVNCLEKWGRFAGALARVAASKSRESKMIPEKKYRLVIAEDHAILRDGLRSLLESRPDCEIVGEATDGREAVRCIAEFEPDLILLDLSMPRANGLEAIAEIKRIRAQTRILVLTAHKSEEYVFAALKAGADGYVLKDAGSAELMAAVKSILAGERFLSPAVATTVVAGYLGSNPGAAPRSPFEDLSVREREVLKLVAEGYRTRDIAEYLCISPKTVEKHRANLMERLSLRTVSALTAYAIEKGLVSK
jgi:DNA-binding NarL/FixJ family response regulator